MINKIRQTLDMVEKLTLHIEEQDINNCFYSVLILIGRDLCDVAEICSQPIPSEFYTKLENGTNILLAKAKYPPVQLTVRCLLAGMSIT